MQQISSIETDNRGAALGEAVVERVTLLPTRESTQETLVAAHIHEASFENKPSFPQEYHEKWYPMV